ncbi:MAG: glycosyltransferase family 2 protein, partial [Actinomycetota bacterium]|nr:glycosyltransferase family 2 protein [Actinomycetota bacterium]
PPPPPHGDPLAVYRAAPPQVHHPRTQAGMATAALKRLETEVRRAPSPSPLARVARLGLRMLPSPVARLAVRALPKDVKDRFRRLASWPEEAARRQAEDRRESFRRRVRAGEFPEIEAPLVSVVIPCYNQGPFLDEALMSVFEQTFDSFEVLVVDDGSDDAETVAVLDGLDLPRTRLLRQANRGLPGARNAGMRHARGEYLVPLDADDQLAPTFLEELLAALQADPEAAFAHCWARLFGDQEAIWVGRPYNPYQLLLSNSITGCVVMRRRAWESVGGYAEDMREGNEDWDLWLRFLEAGWEQAEVRRPLFLYRKHGLSMSVETESRFEQARRAMPQRHPRLYSPSRLQTLKSQWYPWVSVVVSPSSDLASLGAQHFDDLEVVARRDGQAGLEGLCAERGWPLRPAEEGLREAVHAARGKFLIDWDGVHRAAPNALGRLAETLEGVESAAGATGRSQGSVLWRRWALLDPGSPHEGLLQVEVEAEGDPVELGRYRGAFPLAGWALHLDLPQPEAPILRQPPEEEGPLPAWLMMEDRAGTP